MKKSMIFLVVLGLYGCATGYQKSGFTGGYKEKLIGENQYELKYQGNGTTSAATVENYWHRRAQELCGSSEYDFIFTDTSSNIVYIQYGSFEHPKRIGIVTCK